MGFVVHAFLFVLVCASLAITGLMIIHAVIDRRSVSREDMPDAARRDRR